MAKQYGRAGKTLLRQLLLQAAFAFGAWLVAYLLLRLFVPMLAPLAWFIALVPVFKFLKVTRKDRRALSKGYLGEARAGQALRQLPQGWRVFHDVYLDGENADHVIVSPRGVFSVEVKNYGGGILVTNTGLFTHGKRNDKIVKQAWRQSRKLGELLGVEVVPVLAFAGGKVKLESDHVGRLHVLTVGELPAFFSSLHGQALALAEGVRITKLLEARQQRSGPSEYV